MWPLLLMDGSARTPGGTHCLHLGPMLPGMNPPLKLASQSREHVAHVWNRTILWTCPLIFSLQTLAKVLEPSDPPFPHLENGRLLVFPPGAVTAPVRNSGHGGPAA